jgi:hypothetical protein
MILQRGNLAGLERVRVVENFCIVLFSFFSWFFSSFLFAAFFL